MNDKELEVFIQGIRLGVQYGKKCKEDSSEKMTRNVHKKRPKKYLKGGEWSGLDDKIIMSGLSMKETLDNLSKKRTPSAVYGRRAFLKKGNVALLNQ